MAASVRARKPHIPLRLLQQVPGELEELREAVPEEMRARVLDAYAKGGMRYVMYTLMGISRDMLEDDSSSVTGLALKQMAESYILKHPSPGE